MHKPVPKTIERVFDVVARSENLAADAAFVEALPLLDEPLQTAAATRILERANSNGLSGLVGGFRNYGPALQSLLIDQTPRLFEAARTCMSSEVVEARLGAIALIQMASECRLAYLLSSALTRRCPRTRTAAATALLSLARLTAQNRTGAMSPEGRHAAHKNAEQLVEALRIGLDGWQTHHRTEVLLAAMWISDLTERMLVEKATSKRSHITHALGELLRGADADLAAPFTLRALGHSDLRPVALQEIASRHDLAFVSRLLDEIWLTLQPEIANACSWVRQLPSAMLHTLSGRHARAAARLVHLSGLNTENKLAIYRKMIFGGSRELQEAAIWRLTELSTPDATDLLSRVANWNTEPFSTLAAMELFRRDPQRNTRGVKPIGAPDDAGAGDVGDNAFAVYCDRFDVMEEQQRVIEGRKLASHSRTFVERLRVKLGSANAENRLQALRIVRSLQMAADFEERLYALSHDPEKKVRSLALAMLSQLEGATAARILRQALHDPDDRVQANAVEALANRTGNAEINALARKLKADHQRVRANAVKALLARQHRQAAVVLIGMLQNQSAAYRLSALWVVEQLALTTLSPRVQHLAQGDPDHRVRERAAQVFSSMAASTPESLVAFNDRGISP